MFFTTVWTQKKSFEIRPESLLGYKIWYMWPWNMKVNEQSRMEFMWLFPNVCVHRYHQVWAVQQDNTVEQWDYNSDIWGIRNVLHSVINRCPGTWPTIGLRENPPKNPQKTYWRTQRKAVKKPTDNPPKNPGEINQRTQRKPTGEPRGNSPKKPQKTHWRTQRISTRVARGHPPNNPQKSTGEPRGKPSTDPQKKSPKRKSTGEPRGNPRMNPQKNHQRTQRKPTGAIRGNAS